MKTRAGRLEAEEYLVVLSDFGYILDLAHRLSQTVVLAIKGEGTIREQEQKRK